MNKNTLFLLLLIGAGQPLLTQPLSHLAAIPMVATSAIFSAYSLRTALAANHSIPLCDTYHHHEPTCFPEHGSYILFYGGLAASVVATLLAPSACGMKTGQTQVDKDKNRRFYACADWAISAATLYALKERNSTLGLGLLIKSLMTTGALWPKLFSF